MELRDSLDLPVSEYLSPSFAEVKPDDTVMAAAKAMQRSASTEAIVFKEGNPVGVITERDIVYKIVASGLNSSVVKVGDVMTSPLETVEESAKVGEAIAKMSKLGVRRLGVTSKGKLVGIVTQKAIVSGDLHQHVTLPELASPKKLVCPYCDAVMKDRNELSKHIDQVHLGLGLLEGDMSKW